MPLFLKRRCDRTPGGDTGDRLLIHGLWPQWDDASGNRSAVGVDGEALASLYWPQYCDGGAGHDFSVCCEQQRGGGCHDSPASADVCQLPPPRGSAALSRDMPDYVNQVRALHALSESFLSASYDCGGLHGGLHERLRYFPLGAARARRVPPRRSRVDEARLVHGDGLGGVRAASLSDLITLFIWCAVCGAKR